MFLIGIILLIVGVAVEERGLAIAGSALIAADFLLAMIALIVWAATH